MPKTTKNLPQTLLIWENIPEDSSMYLIPNEVADPIRHHLKAAAGHYINSAMELSEETEMGLQYVNTALNKKEYAKPGLEDIAESLTSYKVESGAIEGKVITSVYQMGFLL